MEKEVLEARNMEMQVSDTTDYLGRDTSNGND